MADDRSVKDEEINAGFKSLLEAIATGFAETGAQLGALRQAVYALDARVAKLEFRMDHVETRLDGIDLRLDGIDSRPKTRAVALQPGRGANGVALVGACARGRRHP